jgi:hypothetical protein
MRRRSPCVEGLAYSDPAATAAPTANPMNAAPRWALDALAKRGVHFAICNLSTRRISREATEGGGNAEAVYERGRRDAGARVRLQRVTGRLTARFSGLAGSGSCGYSRSRCCRSGRFGGPPCATRSRPPNVRPRPKSTGLQLLAGNRDWEGRIGGPEPRYNACVSSRSRTRYLQRFSSRAGNGSKNADVTRARPCIAPKRRAGRVGWSLVRRATSYGHGWVQSGRYGWRHESRGTSPRHPSSEVLRPGPICP